MSLRRGRSPHLRRWLPMAQPAPILIGKRHADGPAPKIPTENAPVRRRPPHLDDIFLRSRRRWSWRFYNLVGGRVGDRKRYDGGGWGGDRLAVRTMKQLSLEHLSGARRGEIDALTSLPATIGSGPGVQVLVPGIAPLHAEILRDGHRVVLRDAGSGQDTLLAGAAVQEVALHDGDILELGSSDPAALPPRPTRAAPRAQGLPHRPRGGAAGGRGTGGRGPIG